MKSRIVRCFAVATPALALASCGHASINADTSCADYLKADSATRHDAAVRISSEFPTLPDRGNPMWGLSLDAACGSAPTMTLREYFGRGSTASSQPATSTRAPTPSQPATSSPGKTTLVAPNGASNPRGTATLLTQANAIAITISAEGLPATRAGTAYAVWLYNSRKDSKLLGFANPGPTNGRLSTGGGLPPSASRYKYVILTVETHASPAAPGTIVLKGAMPGM